MKSDTEQDQKSVAAGLDAVRRRIAKSASEYARDPGSVQLVAVGKTHGPQLLLEAYAAGQRHFGENYVQEALPKIAALPADCVWHFIGPIQSNKTRDLAEHFDWIHTVDREKIAQRLSDQRPAIKGPLNVLLQVNISREPSKSGIAPAEVMPLARVVDALPGLRLRGLMAIPAPSADPEEQRAAFGMLSALLSKLRAEGHRHCRDLSMGMSGDMEAAIAEGATLVRIGTDIFGKRGTMPR
jgi:pyridoxal phosphate enzyme (YggS family)